MTIKSNNPNYRKLLIVQRKKKNYNKNMKMFVFKINSKHGTKNINFDHFIVIYNDNKNIYGQP